MHSNTSRNRSASRIRRRRKSSPFRYTVTRSINICITLMVGHPPYVLLSLFFSVRTFLTRLPFGRARTGCPKIRRLPSNSPPRPSTSSPPPRPPPRTSTPPNASRSRLPQHDPASFPEHVAVLHYIYTKKTGENPGWYDEVEDSRWRVRF